MGKFKIAIEWLMGNYKLVILILALAVMSIILLSNKIEIKRLKNDYQIKSVELSVYKDSVAIYKAKNGELTFKIEAVEVESNNRKEALIAAGFERKRLKDMNVKLNEVNFALNAKLKAIGSGTVTLRDTSWIERRDTILAKTGNWSNGYLSLYPEVVGNELNFDYTYEVGLKVLKETNKTISIGLTDPKASIVSSNSVIIKKKDRIWNKWYVHAGVGLVGGYFLFK
jgi:hypothetical protein